MITCMAPFLLLGGLLLLFLAGTTPPPAVGSANVVATAPTNNRTALGSRGLFLLEPELRHASRQSSADQYVGNVVNVAHRITSQKEGAGDEHRWRRRATAVVCVQDMERAVADSPFIPEFFQLITASGYGVSDMGSFSQCVRANGNYWMVNYNYSYVFSHYPIRNVTNGLCAPKSCEEADLATHLATYFINYLSGISASNMESVTIHQVPRNPTPLDRAAWAVLVLLGVWVLWIVLCTYLDVRRNQRTTVGVFGVQEEPQTGIYTFAATFSWKCLTDPLDTKVCDTSE